MKLILHEMQSVFDGIREDELEPVYKTLDRIATIQRHMIHSWEILATLTPHDFLTFRGYLRKASGFQSYQYRALEFYLGNKNADLIVVHKDDPPTLAVLQKILDSPSLYDEVLKLLSRRGFDIPAAALDRDWSQPYEPRSEIEAVWKSIYTDVGEHWGPVHAGRENHGAGVLLPGMALQAHENGVARNR